MPILLYIETNLILSYATGRDAATDRLLSGSPDPARLLMPSCCVMEALTALGSMRKARRQFEDALRAEIVQARRNVVSPNAGPFLEHLRASLSDSEVISDELDLRLFRAIDALSTRATLIEATPEVIRASIARPIIADPTDNLILTCILDHAANHPSELKALLTENRRCFFDDPHARAALDGAGIKYFAEASKCLEWQDRSPESRMGG